MIVLSIRVEIEIIFKNTYVEFFSVHSQEQLALILINGVITKLLDPNLFFSRFSFLESGKDALLLKTQKHKGTLPKLRHKFYTRSALVSSLIPHPSEGKVRALFGSEKVILPDHSDQMASEYYDEETEEDKRQNEILDMINRVQLYQIAMGKIMKTNTVKKEEDILSTTS